MHLIKIVIYVFYFVTEQFNHTLSHIISVKWRRSHRSIRGGRVISKFLECILRTL